LKSHMVSLNILPIVRKEFRQIKRDKRILSILLFIPALMLLMFGYALNFDVKHTSMAVYDEDRSSTSREFVEQFFISEYFTKVQTLESKAEINNLLDAEQARVVLVIPSSFTKDIQRGRAASVQVIVDGANSNAASTVLGYINAIIQQYSVKVMTESFVRMGQQNITMPIDFKPRVWYNPELESAKFLVPGLIAFILMVTAVVSTAMAIVRERELGTMEQLMVSPIKPIELILGKTIPYTLISLFATVTVLFLGYILFDVSIKGSIFLLSLVTFIFFIGSLGMGLLISTMVETQQLAFMIAAIVSMLPTFIQGITYLLPARYFLVVLRAIILKGAGLSAFWDQALILAIYAFFMISISSLRMRKILR